MSTDAANAADEAAEPGEDNRPEQDSGPAEANGSFEDHEYDYDLIVVGSGPGGSRAAISAVKLGRRVAIVERRSMMGGSWADTGTLPSKTFREAVVFLMGLNQREMYGQSYRVKDDVTIADLTGRANHVIHRDIEILRSQLLRNHIDMIEGDASFLDPHTLSVEGERPRTVTAARFVLAPGTVPARPASVAFDGQRILDTDSVMGLERIPESMVVVGAGPIGVEYASMFAALGTRVTIIDVRQAMLEFCDEEVVESLRFHLRDLGVTFRFGESVVKVAAGPRGTVTYLESGKRVPAETVLYCAGRDGATASMRLDRAGLLSDRRGRIKVNARYQTNVPHIYAAGDVIGFPALASTSMEQGRLAGLYSMGEDPHGLSPLHAIGVYTIPEISYVGQTEAQLTDARIPYVVGLARYRELSRGQILGDSYGMLKLLVHNDTGELLGVHLFGTSATELVHIGQAVMGCGGTIDYLVNAVFNHPTLAGAYKVAALDAHNKIRDLSLLG